MSISPSAAPLVSCLCVTRHRVPLLHRAVQCYLRQTLPSRELVVVFESDDAATRGYLGNLSMHPDIRSLEIAVEPKSSLGTLRNLAVAAARGEYVAQWDDDDWHAPERLAEQLAVLQGSDRDGCVLLQVVLHDTASRRSWLSARRPWEGSLLARRSALPPYPSAVPEDTPVIKAMFEGSRLLGLQYPMLYVYVRHGRNTWGDAHWLGWLFAQAEPLTAEESALVCNLLYDA